MAEFNQKIINMWGPIVDKHLVIKNNYFKYLTCHYFHFLSLSNNGGDISEDILQFKDKISNLRSYKKEIKKEYINILTGRKEFLLEDGTIFEPSSIDFFLTTEQLVEIFGIDFITSLNPTLSRDFKINQIIGNGN
jgi:hypothetical protein